MATTKTKKMTGNDVRALREGLEMSTAQFGKLLGLGPSAVTRWEAKKSKAVRMDPFAARVAEIIVGQSKKLGKSKFGEIVNKALEHEHDLFALWQILSMAFGESMKLVKKITGGGKKAKAKRAAKKTARVAKREVKARTRRTAPRAKRAARAKRTTKTTAPVKAKRARPAKGDGGNVPTSESKITPSAAKDHLEAAASETAQQ